MIRNRNLSREEREFIWRHKGVSTWHFWERIVDYEREALSGFLSFSSPWSFSVPLCMTKIPFLSLALSLILSGCNGSPNIQSFSFQVLGTLSFLLSLHTIRLRPSCLKLRVQPVAMLYPIISRDSLWSQKLTSHGPTRVSRMQWGFARTSWKDTLHLYQEVSR